MKKVLIFALSIMFSFGMIAVFVAPAYAADGDHEHELQYVPAKELVAYYDPGYSEHWECITCGSWFDASGNEIDPESIMIRVSPENCPHQQLMEDTVKIADATYEHGSIYEWTCYWCKGVFRSEYDDKIMPLVTSMTFDKQTYNWKDTITVRVDYTSNIDLKGMINLDCVGVNTGLMFFFSPGSWEETEGLLTYEEGYDPDTGKGYVIYHRTANPSDPIDDYRVCVAPSCDYDVDNSIWEKYDNKEPIFSIRPFGDRDSKFCASDIENAQEKIDALEDGDILVITLHDSMNIFKKEWFDAIKGKDITIVVPRSSYGFIVFNGKDIINETKDISLSTSINGGGRADDDDGGPWFALKFWFPNNGVLPCKIRYYYSYDFVYEFVRTGIDSRYITPDDVMREMELYYINNGMLVHEPDGISNNGEWIVLELEHNSSFLATSFAPELIRTFDATMSKSVFKYNGKVQKPSLKYTRGADVKAIYSNKKSTDIGTYKVTAKGCGNDCGIKMMKYKIIPSDVTGLKVASSGSKRLKVTYKNAGGGVKYQVAYRLKNASKWNTVSVKGTSKSLTNLKAGKTYQVRVRAYKRVNGETYYGAWTGVRAGKVR